MKEAMNDKMIRGYWFLSNNFGDCLNKFLLRTISGREVVASVDKSEPHFIVCGSILSEANKNSTVWGAGFSWRHHSRRDLYGCENVVAVRGDLSAERTGMDLKAIGDPALLLPLLLDEGDVGKHYKIGVVPHWTNIAAAVEGFGGVRVISPLLPVRTFIREIRKCEYVFSESLHGLIVSDAYGVPNAWMKMGANVGDGFKYDDYYSSTIYPETDSVNSLDTKLCRVHNYKYNLQTLLNSCPFYGLNK